MSIGSASLKHLNLPISIKISVTICLYLHDSSITNFDFINYAVFCQGCLDMGTNVSTALKIRGHF